MLKMEKEHKWLWICKKIRESANGSVFD